MSGLDIFLMLVIFVQGAIYMAAHVQRNWDVGQAYRDGYEKGRSDERESAAGDAQRREKAEYVPNRRFIGPEPMPDEAPDPFVDGPNLSPRGQWRYNWDCCEWQPVAAGVEATQ